MFQAIGLGLGAIGTIGRLFGRGKANRQLRRLMKENPIYQENPLAKQRLGLANTLLNARSPGAAAAEQNIYNTQANTISRGQRGATDASQFLSFAGDTQTQVNNAFNDLGQFEAQDYQRRYGNQVAAQEGLIREQDKVFQDSVRRWQDKAALQGAQIANNANSWDDIGNFGFALSDFGMNGGFGNMFKSRGATPQPADNFQYTNYRRPTYNPQTGRIE